MERLNIARCKADTKKVEQEIDKLLAEIEQYNVGCLDESEDCTHAFMVLVYERLIKWHKSSTCAPGAKRVKNYLSLIRQLL